MDKTERIGLSPSAAKMLGIALSWQVQYEVQQMRQRWAFLEAAGAASSRLTPPDTTVNA